MGKSYDIQNFMTNVDVALDKKQALTQLGLEQNGRHFADIFNCIF